MTTIMIDRNFIRSYGLSSGTLLNRWDDSDDVGAENLSERKSEVMRGVSPYWDMFIFDRSDDRLSSRYTTRPCHIVYQYMF